MTESTPDDERLRAAEGQMRRALGLQHEPAQSTAPKTISAGANPQRRHFVRDGDVPVTIVHGEHGNSLVQQLDAARQALRTQTTAFEEAERALVEARNTIRDLRTKLAHESLAKDEAGSHADAEHQRIGRALATVQQELAAERASREQMEAERDRAIARLRITEERVQHATVTWQDEGGAKLLAATSDASRPPRRRGRPPKAASSEIVEWWTPGWQEKYR
jgi:prefoldin subunit 5